MTRVILPALLACLFPLATVQPSDTLLDRFQDSDAPAKQEPRSRPKKAKGPKPWPKLAYTRKQSARDAIVKLGSKKEANREKARERLLKYGTAAVPYLLNGLNDRQKPEVLPELEALLDELVTPEWGPTLEAGLKPKKRLQAHYITGRLKSFQDKRYADTFRKMADHEDEGIRETASLALAGIGDVKALDFLIERTRKDWAGDKKRILEVLSGLRGHEATEKLLRLLRSKKTADKLVALRLLNGAGVKEAASTVAPYLKSHHNALRTEAVNALRGMVDGKPPHDHLPVFKSIEVVKKWKRRMGV